MQPAVSVQDVRRISPVWLRPSAIGLVLCLHLVLLVGIPWPAGMSIPEPPPIEIQVIPQAEPAQLLVPLASAPVLEVKPANATPVDVQAVEAQPLRHGQEIAELKPSESAFAAASPAGVVSLEPQAAELKPLDVRQPTAPVPVAQPAPEAARAEASTLATSPPSQPLSSERPVAESEPLEVRPPTAPLQATQPAREVPGAAALAINPPNQPLPSEQPVAESERLEVPRPTAPLQAALPTREAPGVVASGLAISPPSQPLSSQQPVADSEPLEVPRPTAPLQATQPAREAPSVVASALAISPPSQSLLSEQQVAALVPPGVPEAKAPVRVSPSAREVPMTQSPAAASNSPTQGTVSPPEQHVTKLEPYSPNAAPPLQDEGPIVAGRVGEIVRYVEQYDGGRCFFVAPVAVTETEAKLEGYGASARPFEALDTAFRHENGFEASIDVRLVTPAQCPAVAFLGRLRGANAPHLHIDGVNLGPGGVLTGTVDGYGSRNVELLVANDAGTVQNVSRLLKPGTPKTFTISRRDIARASDRQPQLLIVVASPLPLDALRFDRPVEADRLFSAVLTEAARKSQPVAAMARYFKLER